MTDSATIPAAKRTVFEAVAAAAAEMKRLPKDSRNHEGKYDFASVDDFLAMTGPVCAKHGLTIVMDEVALTDIERQGRYGVTQWCRFVFSLTIFDKHGDSLPTVRRTVEVIRNGAQTTGSAQSYALKQFLRATFQIPTGDQDDPDHGDDARGNRAQPQRRDEPAASPALDDIEAFGAKLRRAMADIDRAGTLDELKSVWAAINATDRAVAADAAVIRRKDARRDALTKAEQAAAHRHDDPGADSLPCWGGPA